MNSDYKLNIIDHSVHGYETSGIMLVATTMQVSSAKDKNPVIGDMSFYGIIEDIWEVSYNTFNSFIIATHGKQVFYVSDLVDPRWSVVVMPPQKTFRTNVLMITLEICCRTTPQSQNGIQQVTLMKVGIHTLDLTVKAHRLPLDFHRTKPVGDTNPTVMKQTYFMFKTIVDMVDSQDVATPKKKGESSTQKRKRGPIEMKEITRARSEGQKLVIQYNELGQAIGQNATKLKSFIGTTVRFHVPIIYSDWPMVPKEIKDKIFELIEAGFVVDPRSKKTIIQNVGYSFIDQQHWTEFVASRLKEDFKKKSENGKEKRKKHKYNHKTSRKGYANLMEELIAPSSDQIDRSIVWKQARMDRKGQISDEETKEVVNLIDELVATQNTTNAFGEEDILTRALGGKDRPGILHGVGKYVIKKKIKELEEELLKMKEKNDCVGDLKEEPGMSSKEKSSMEGAENVNNLEDLSNELESEKDVEDVVELNEDIKVNIVKDDEEVKGVTLDKMKVSESKVIDLVIKLLCRRCNAKVAVDVVVDGDCAIPIPSEQGMYKMSQEVGSHILWPRDLVITNNIKGAAFWIDPLKNRIDPDITKVVERSFNLMNKKKPNWRVVKMKDSPRAYTQDDIDCIRSEWAEFVGKHVHCA
ncbi:uncharacterized protein E5676_scaffold265G001650 [Cucumis melo var. makuwa]|uniref:DUF4216 domain-containing protein n=1 Tax=Cucumis melo var. makuwa TaxID=1194695 RepID=A0A5A7U3K8_CUCMM|nr:uncharacterized protein E6C27_scaffold63G001510 [Cucumis melo var. makuwa]TYK08020.1 uncharacterized protein E5676_scaffold265G001650 [Cucumis melo var. makuwa]